MKNSYYKYAHKSELSPDLEWMLQSGQVSLKLLVETLVDTYYNTLYHLAVMLLDDTRAARVVVRETITHAILNLHNYRSQMGVESWLYSIEWASISRVKRKERVWQWLEEKSGMAGEFTERWIIRPPTALDHAIWWELDRFPAEARTLILLTYGCGWSSSRIAEIVGMDADEVDAQLAHFLAELDSAVPEAGARFEAILRRSIEERWPIIPAEEKDLRSLALRIEMRAGKGYGLRGRLATVKEMAIIGVAILLVAIIIWGGSWYFLRVDSAPSPGRFNNESGMIHPGHSVRNDMLGVSVEEMDILFRV